jgi:hypothetical protein
MFPQQDVSLSYEGKTELIQQKDFYIGFPRGFVVSEGKQYIVCDSRAADFKIYDSSGVPLAKFGRKGYGPDEFISPWLHDYSNNMLLFSDTSTEKLYIYEISENLSFKKVYQLFATSVLDAKLMAESKQVLICRFPIPDDPKKKTYFIVLTKTFDEKNTDYLLPFEIQLGKNAKPVDFDKLKKINPSNFPDFIILPAWKFCDYYNDDIYFVWTANLEPVRINLITKQFTFFGEKTKNYIKPYVSSDFKQSYLEMNSKKYRSFISQMSWVSKIFVDSELLGIIFSNYDKLSSRWKAFLQIYDRTGRFIREQPLQNFSNSYDQGNFFYDKKSKTLYCLSDSSSGDIGNYYVFKYKIILKK